MEELKVTLQDPKKADYFYEEAMKTFRTNILFSSKQMKCILLTSCYPNEGKSDLAFNLAIEMGKAGRKVLLLDADIRKSNFVKRYKVNKQVQGLSQYLSGQVDKQWITYQTNYTNLDIVFAGAYAPNPSELLGDPLFDAFLEEKREEYDYIFIDTPPLGNITDAAVVAEHCDGAVLVIESEAVSYKVARRIKEQLEKSGCTILGAVLNKVDLKKDKYYSSYYRHYGGYYKKN